MDLSQFWAAVGAIAAVASAIVAIVRSSHRSTGDAVNVNENRKKFKRMSPGDTRTSLMILPFQDFSPDNDNLWFADALPGELIDSLSQIKSLRVLDRNTSKNLRDVKQSTNEIAELFDTQYVLEGAITKIGEKIKISASLLDPRSGSHLWQYNFNGVMDDIFVLIENVVQKIVEGLKIHLTKEEKNLLQERGTESSEAYELFAKAREYFLRQTKESTEYAIQLCAEAIKLDPSYANAYQLKANALASLYRDYTHDPAMLKEGLQLVQEALRLKPNLWEAYLPLSFLYLLDGNTAQAEQAAKDYIQNAPDEPRGYFALGNFYSFTNQPEKAIAPFEQAVKLRPDSLTALFNLVNVCDRVDNVEKRVFWAQLAVPRYERYLKLFPDDEYAAVNYALLLHWAGKEDASRAAARGLVNVRDGVSLFNTACLQRDLMDFEGSLKTFRKAIEAGLSDYRSLKEFLNDERGLGKLKGVPEYEEVDQMIAKLAEV